MDVYGLQILDATLKTGDAGGGGGHGGFGTAAKAQALTEGSTTSRGEVLSGALQQPELRGLGQLYGGRLPAGGLHDPERPYTLTPERRCFFGCRYLQLGDVRRAADNDCVSVTGTFLGTASQNVWNTARLDFSVPPGGLRSSLRSFRRLDPRLVQQSAGTLDLYSL